MQHHFPISTWTFIASLVPVITYCVRFHSILLNINTCIHIAHKEVATEIDYFLTSTGNHWLKSGLIKAPIDNKFHSLDVQLLVDHQNLF